jgi:Pyruvate/2-oxoacid:ferredoxin oxidoreductase delta subunit
MNIKKTFKRRIRKTTWGIFNYIVRIFPRMKFGNPMIGSSLKKLFKLDPSEKTQTYILSLNENITDDTKNVVLPIDMMKKMVMDSKYRAIMYGCLCRTANSCHSYPVNHGCIFIGESAKAIVEKRVGKEASVEESISHIDKGAELGLVGQAMWVEVEKYLFGFKSGDDIAHWLEICFCCPCCCSAFKLIRTTNQTDIKERFRSIGWKAFIDNNICNMCKKCIKKCPINAISAIDDKINIDVESCLGCGLCAANCLKKAIKLNLQNPLKNNIQEYFIDGGLRVDL